MLQPQATGLSLVVIRSTRRAGRREAVLSEPWFYCSRVTDNLYAVPAGYVTDFASVPPFAKLLFPEFGTSAEAAVIHDWLYDVGAHGGEAEADRIFREALDDQEVSQPRKSLMHAAVRVGGGPAYRRAEQRVEEDWKAHFVDRFGRQLPEPPFPQPLDPVWRRDFDCARLESAAEVEALLEEYIDEHPRAFW